MEYGNVLPNSQLEAGAIQSRSTNQVQRTNTGFGSDLFLQLLAAQLQFQDPFESVDNTQMVLQMAQFATIEALDRLNQQFGVFMETSAIQDGAALVGKEVRIAVDDETTIIGTVQSVGFTSQGSVVKVNGEFYPSWRIIEIGNEGSLEADSTPESGEQESEVE